MNSDLVINTSYWSDQVLVIRASGYCCKLRFRIMGYCKSSMTSPHLFVAEMSGQKSKTSLSKLSFFTVKLRLFLVMAEIFFFFFYILLKLLKSLKVTVFTD